MNGDECVPSRACSSGGCCRSDWFPTGISGLYPIEAGKYRSGEMQVVSGAMGMEKVHYQAPSAD